MISIDLAMIFFDLSMIFFDKNDWLVFSIIFCEVVKKILWVVAPLCSIHQTIEAQYIFCTSVSLITNLYKSLQGINSQHSVFAGLHDWFTLYWMLAMFSGIECYKLTYMVIIKSIRCTPYFSCRHIQASDIHSFQVEAIHEFGTANQKCFMFTSD